jgi:hypothetical protein
MIHASAHVARGWHAPLPVGAGAARGRPLKRSGWQRRRSSGLPSDFS